MGLEEEEEEEEKFGIGGGGEGGKEEGEEGEVWLAGEKGAELEGAAVEWEGSWAGLEEKGMRRKGGRMGCRREEAEVEGVAVKGKGSWAGLEKDYEGEKWVRKNGRRGKERSSVWNGWRWMELP